MAKWVGIDYWRWRRRMQGAVRTLLRRRGAGASWYDSLYAKQPEAYMQHYSDSLYFPLWEEIANRTPITSSVLEIGCGTGQLAELLHDRGVRRYAAFDFSAAAISIAKRRLPALEFYVADARFTELLEHDAEIVICTEVLEHIHEDLDVLRRIRTGTRVLATVPDFDSNTHVRWFSSVDEVRDRYGALFTDLQITEHEPPLIKGRLFLLDGKRGD